LYKSKQKSSPLSFHLKGHRRNLFKNKLRIIKFNKFKLLIEQVCLRCILKLICSKIIKRLCVHFLIGSVQTEVGGKGEQVAVFHY
jgi:hypothetical protein